MAGAKKAAKKAVRKTVKKATAAKPKAAGARSRNEAKTRPTAASVEDYLAAVADPERQKDCRALARLMTKVTGKKPVMWGPGIVGFDSYHYRYESGREGDSCLLGFSSRKADLTIYLASGIECVAPLLADLGKCTHAKACLYVKRLADVDLAVLERVLRIAAAETRRRYP